MISFLDVLDRATNGPIVSVKDYDMKRFIPKVQEMVKKYKIKCDPKTPCPWDDDLADRIYQAAMDLYIDVGTYCTDTGRAHSVYTGRSGTGRLRMPERSLFRRGTGPGRFQGKKTRQPGDPSLPRRIRNRYHRGSGIENGRGLRKNYQGKNGEHPLGHVGRSSQELPMGSPLETLAGIYAMRVGREGLRRAGRPGMGIINHMSSCAAGVSTIAASHPEFGARPSDGWLVAPHAELKIDYSSLNQVAFLTSWGANIGQEAGPILGGYAGGPEGTAVVTTAYAFHGILVVRATYHLTYPIQMIPVCSTTPNMLWVMSTSSQAINRNLRVPYYALGYASAGSATKQYFYEAAAYLCAIQSSGMGIEDVHPNKAVLTNGALPIDSEFTCAFGHGMAGITRKEANAIILKLLDKYVR